jgi:hypothetical protein
MEGPLWWVAEDAHLWPQPARRSSPRKTIYGRLASGITGSAGNMIHARWNELELGRLFRTPPDLMLGLGKKLDPGSILNPAERMVIENVAQLDHLRLELILRGKTNIAVTRGNLMAQYVRRRVPARGRPLLFVAKDTAIEITFRVNFCDTRLG